jgi:hypothetical protein
MRNVVATSQSLVAFYIEPTTEATRHIKFYSTVTWLCSFQVSLASGRTAAERIGDHARQKKYCNLQYSTVPGACKVRSMSHT